MALDAGLIRIRSLAQAAKNNQDDGMALNRYGEVMPPAVALDMIALIETLQAEVEALRQQAGRDGGACAS